MPKLMSYLQEHWLIGMLSGFGASFLAVWSEMLPYLQVIGVLLGLLIAATTAYLNFVRIAKEKAEKRVFEKQAEFLKETMDKDKKE